MTKLEALDAVETEGAVADVVVGVVLLDIAAVEARIGLCAASSREMSLVGCATLALYGAGGNATGAFPTADAAEDPDATVAAAGVVEDTDAAWMR